MTSMKHQQVWTLALLSGLHSGAGCTTGGRLGSLHLHRALQPAHLESLVAACWLYMLVQVGVAALHYLDSISRYIIDDDNDKAERTC